jgi:hypothetical protein
VKWKGTAPPVLANKPAAGLAVKLVVKWKGTAPPVPANKPAAGLAVKLVVKWKGTAPSVSASKLMDKLAVKKKERSTSEPAVDRTVAAAVRSRSEPAPGPARLVAAVQEKKKAANELGGSKKKIKRSPTQEKVNWPKL